MPDGAVDEVETRELVVVLVRVLNEVELEQIGGATVN